MAIVVRICAETNTRVDRVAGGELGVLHAQLAKRGWTNCLPQTEHAELDLIA